MRLKLQRCVTLLVPTPPAWVNAICLGNQITLTPEYCIKETRI
jgi:hypothetical protein